jgi:hypothetical protein
MNDSVQCTVTTEVNLTPRILGKLFAEMGSDQQAEFFDEAAAVAEGWGAMGEVQWLYVREELSPRALELLLMLTIGHWMHECEQSLRTRAVG